MNAQFQTQRVECLCNRLWKLGAGGGVGYNRGEDDEPANPVYFRPRNGALRSWSHPRRNRVQRGFCCWCFCSRALRCLAGQLESLGPHVVRARTGRLGFTAAADPARFVFRFSVYTGRKRVQSEAGTSGRSIRTRKWSTVSCPMHQQLLRKVSRFWATWIWKSRRHPGVPVKSSGFILIHRSPTEFTTR